MADEPKPPTTPLVKIPEGVIFGARRKNNKIQIQVDGIWYEQHSFGVARTSPVEVRLPQGGTLHIPGQTVTVDIDDKWWPAYDMKTYRR